MGVFKPQHPAILPTPDAFMKGCIEIGSDIIYCVPAFVEVRDFNRVALLLIKIFVVLVWLSQVCGLYEDDYWLGTHCEVNHSSDLYRALDIWRRATL
jgi:hypothetical protein